FGHLPFYHIFRSGSLFYFFKNLESGDNITEKSNIIFHVVPHGSEHISENAIEYTDAKYDMTSLYEAVHSSCYGYCIFGEVPDVDYDLFMLADDGTELDSITFEVK
ncbi:MAG: hypothetical protein K2H89_08330, partial [Oscillospiraceae bacterium]|nr:hypothetical protein [Oscillospiraceae bacterium]